MFKLSDAVFDSDKMKHCIKHYTKGFKFVSFQMGRTGRVTARPGHSTDIKLKRGCVEYELWDATTATQIKIEEPRKVIVETIDDVYYIDEDHMEHKELMAIIPMTEVFQADGWVYILDQEVLEELADKFEWNLYYIQKG